MGIHGLFKELGPPPRRSLASVAASHYATHSRPLVLAIDISIWLFQIQSGKGGSNPALRTFYYRLLRLLSININPLFVFDGPNKPLFKRNKKVGGPGVRVASVPEFLAKQLLKQFGFPWHAAPGEAEAECAMLQRGGVCDAVLSEDVDTLMFGSKVTFRNWAAGDGVASSNKTPTHVSVYREQETRERSKGIDREGMILVALMSGGDYLPEGISGCGPKVACDAARAGFGASLCSLRRSDTAGLQAWKDKLQHEIRTNESKFFSRRNNGFTIPDDFPNQEVLGYYTHPCVSTPEKVARLRAGLRWDQDIDFQALRAFAGDAFDWRCVGGAKKFIKNLAPALLVRQLRMNGEGGTEESQEAQEVEGGLVKAVHGKRNHASVDGEMELRVLFVPASLVPIDLDEEEEDDEFLPAGGATEETDTESEFAGMAPPSTAQDEDDEDGEPAKKKRVPRPFDPDQPEKIWVLRTWAQVGCPLLVGEYEASFRDPKEFLKQRRKAKAAETTGNIHAAKPKKAAGGKGRRKKGDPSSDAVTPAENALTRFTKVTKTGVDREPLAEKSSSQGNSQPPPSSAPAAASMGIGDADLDRLMGFKRPSTQGLDKLLARAKSARSATPPAMAPQNDDHETVDLSATTPRPRPFAAFAAAAAAEPTARAAGVHMSSSDLLDFTTAPRPFAPHIKPAAKPKPKVKGKQAVPDVQGTPQRRKRRSPALSSPAMPSSQQTITAYYSPSPRRPSTLFPGLDAEVVNLVSSSPAKLAARSPPRALTPSPPNLRDKFVRSPSPVAAAGYAALLGLSEAHEGVPEFSPGKLPDTVTKRRRKGSIRRWKTAPALGDADHSGLDGSYDGGGGFLLDDDDGLGHAEESSLRFSPEREVQTRRISASPTFRERLLGAGGIGAVLESSYPTPPTTAGNDAAPLPAPARAVTSKPTKRTSTQSTAPPAVPKASAPKVKARPKTTAVTSPPHQSGQPSAIRRSPRQAQAQKKRAFILRQSLEGAWKEVDAEAIDMTGDGSGWKATGGKAKIIGTKTTMFRKSGVELLDMTGA